MGSARMKISHKIMFEEKEQGEVKGTTDFWKVVTVIFTCFATFSGSQVLEVDFLKCLSLLSMSEQWKGDTDVDQNHVLQNWVMER